MIVKCLATTGEALFPRTRRIGYNSESKFAPLEVGELYSVYGMYLWKGNLHYLVIPRYEGEDMNPFFDPAELFEVVDGRIPDGWHFRWLGGEEADEAIWGYRELALDYPTHMASVVERDPVALRVFSERRREIDRSLAGK